jgi:hypothetical protein
MTVNQLVRRHVNNYWLLSLAACTASSDRRGWRWRRIGGGGGTAVLNRTPLLAFRATQKLYYPVRSHSTTFSCSKNCLAPSLFPVAPTLEHRVHVKRFVSLQFLNPKKVGRTPWMTDQPIANPLPEQTHNKHKQRSIPWVGFEPMIPVFDRAKAIHVLNRAVTVVGAARTESPEITT